MVALVAAGIWRLSGRRTLFCVGRVRERHETAFVLPYIPPPQPPHCDSARDNLFVSSAALLTCAKRPSPQTMSLAEAPEDSQQDDVDDDDSIEVLLLSCARVPLGSGSVAPDTPTVEATVSDAADGSVPRGKLATVGKGSRVPLRLEQEDLLRLEQEAAKRANLTAKAAPARTGAPALPLPPVPIAAIPIPGSGGAGGGSGGATVPAPARSPRSLGSSSGSVAIAPSRADSRSNIAASITHPIGLSFVVWLAAKCCA